MRHAGRLFAATSLLLLPVAACSLLVDTSGLATDVMPTSDATSSAVDAGDSPSAMTPVDGSVPIDAGDAGAADSSAPACTASATTICEDFDESPAPDPSWSKENDRGSLAFDAVGLSAPHAFEATILAGAGGGTACLKQNYSARTNVRCEFDLKLIAVPATSEIDLIDFITQVPGASEYHVYVGCFSGVWEAAEYQSSSDAGAGVDRQADLGTALPSNTWFHVVFEQSGTSATLTANGSIAKLTALSVPASGATTSVNIGITYAAPQVQSADIVIDNVACTVLP